MVHTLGSLDMYHFKQVFLSFCERDPFSRQRTDVDPKIHGFIYKLQGHALVMGEGWWEALTNVFMF